MPLVALVGAAVAIAGLLFKNTCVSSSWGGTAFTYQNLCYSDIGPLYFLRGFADGLIPYFNSFEGQYLEYPVLTGITMWVASFISHALSNSDSAAPFVYTNWAFNVILISSAVWVMSLIKSANKNAAWWFAFSPALFLTLGINWDALAVLCAIFAIHMWQKDSALGTGIAIGLGTAAKLFPALILIPIAIDVIRKRNMRIGLETLVAATTTWLLVNAPFMVFAHEGWLEFYKFSSTRGIDFGSLWLGLNYVFSIDVSTHTANLLGLIAVGICALALYIFRNRIDFVTGVFVIIAVFTLFNKVYSPQFWIWLAPIAALTAIRLKQFVVWNLVQTLYFYCIWRYLLFLTEPALDGVVNSREYGLAILLNWIATATLIALAVRRSPSEQSILAG
ncbi:MAG: hypothetical protein RLZZ508_935 [Actinomycetota bacterium]